MVVPESILKRLSQRLVEMKGKQETVKELANVFKCPKNSLYIPIRQLERAGFLKLRRGTGVIIYNN